MPLPAAGLPGFKYSQSTSILAVRAMIGLHFSSQQHCLELPAGLAVCRAPLYEEVVHALIGRVHLRKGLAESQLLALPCTVVASYITDSFIGDCAGPGFFIHSQCLGIPLQLSKDKQIRVKRCQLCE